METITVKVRLYPNNTQSNLLNLNIDAVRFVYNKLLEIQITDNYKHSYVDMTNMLPTLKNNFGFLKLANSQSLQQTLKKLDITIKNYKYKKTGKPKFRSYFKDSKYFVVPQHFKVDFINKSLSLPKIGFIKFRHKLTNYKINTIKQIVVTKDKYGRFYASMVCLATLKTVKVLNNALGIDVGVINLLTDSLGNKVKPLHKNTRLIKYLNKIKKLQVVITKLKYRSINYNKVIRKMNNYFIKINNIKKDKLHKVTNYYAKYKHIVLEKLNIQKMTRNTRGTVNNPNKDSKRKSNLNRVILSNNWYMFIMFLNYKLKHRGNVLNIVEPEYTSQTCFICKHVNKDNRNGSRFKCVKCSHEDDADINAAKNILIKAGIRNVKV